MAGSPAAMRPKSNFSIVIPAYRYDAVGCPGRFVGKSLMGGHEIGFLHLAVIVAPAQKRPMQDT
jgi:hypothetical protein